MTRKRSSSKPSTPISLFRGAVGSKKTQTLAKALEGFKAKGQIEKFPSIYVLASHNTQFSYILQAGIQVKELRHLGAARVLKPTSFYREVQWAAVICYNARKIINKFLRQREEFYAKFASRDFSRASEILNEIDKTCGKSLWTIENRICLLSYSEGFEAQKKYVSSITKEYPKTHVAFMTAYIGERNELRVTAKAFEQRFRHRSTSWDIDRTQLTHILYRLCNTIEPSEESYSAILTYEASYSAIDLYETLLVVNRRAKCMPFYDSISMEAALDYLNEISDCRKDTLIKYVKDEDQAVNENIPDYNIYFRSGMYHRVIQSVSEVLSASPWNLDAMVACAKACTASEIDPPHLDWFGELIVQNLYSFYVGAADAEIAVDSLIKTANNFRHADFSVPLIMLMKSRTHRWFYRAAEQCSLINIFIPNHVSFIERHSNNLSTSGEAVETNDFKNASNLYSSILQDDVQQALHFAEELISSSILYYRMLGKSFHANLLAKDLQISQALDESVEALIEHPGLVEFTPLIDIIRSRGYRHLKDLASSPTLSSAFHIYTEHTESSEKDVALKVAWKNYLENKGISKPSEFKPDVGYTKVESFFLSDICTQETMELGGAFSSQLDLDRERMAICANLATAFPADSIGYNSEIVDLTRRINIEDGVEFLESSRIFVDEIGIQKWAKKNLNSQFLRYKDYLGVGLTDSVEQMTKDVSQILSGDEYMTAITNYLENYDTSADGLLEDVVRELSQAFLQLPRYGLDSFLSSRVRHGSFVGYIRGPLESHRLVTKKKTDSTKYYDNDYMLDKWTITGERGRRLINARLAVLSEAVDSALDEMVEKYLHVQSKSHPDGKVTFNPENRPISKILKSWAVITKANLGENTQLEELVTFSFENYLWPSVRPALGMLKEYVQTNLSDQLSELLNNFVIYAGGIVSRDEKELIAADVALVISELRDALRRVSLWFDLPQASGQMLSMTLERVLEIGLRSSQNARFGFKPVVDWKIDPEANVQIKGQTISILNDLAFLIFTNISKHSGFEDGVEFGEQANVSIALNSVNGTIKIIISNNISEKKSLETIKLGLTAASERINNKDFDALDKQKEGTGLARLAVYFDSDDVDSNYFSYWLSEEERRFYVQLHLPAVMVRAIGGGN